MRMSITQAWKALKDSGERRARAYDRSRAAGARLDAQLEANRASRAAQTAAELAPDDEAEEDATDVGWPLGKPE